jgi:hypothetical protein
MQPERSVVLFSFMKFSICLLRSVSASCPAILLGLALAADAAQSPAAPGAKPAGTAGAQTNAVLQSVFVLPHSPQEGRDPFFPNSTRPYSTFAPTPNMTNAPAPMQVVDLRLKGFSGPADRRLAIINNHTFEAGEEAEVIMGPGRIPIRCLEIRADSVVVEIRGERRELRLRPGV